MNQIEFREFSPPLPNLDLIIDGTEQCGNSEANLRCTMSVIFSFLITLYLEALAAAIIVGALTTWFARKHVGEDFQR